MHSSTIEQPAADFRVPWRRLDATLCSLEDLKKVAIETIGSHPEPGLPSRVLPLTGEWIAAIRENLPDAMSKGIVQLV